ncbi:GTPase, partial [Neisseria sp. P0009.S004]|uniref:GTPase n=1 Tax=Neisseria sp. P0009.S004 TaxID=3436711 RepID=UPI003F7E8F24
TRNRVTGIYTDDTAQFVFVDTPVFQTNHRNALNDRLNQNLTEALSGVDVVIFVVEALRFTVADRVVLKQLHKHTPVV